MKVLCALIAIAAACGTTPGKRADPGAEQLATAREVPRIEPQGPKLPVARAQPPARAALAACGQANIEPLIDAPLAALQRVFDSAPVDREGPHDVVVVRFAACRYGMVNQSCYRDELKGLRVFLRPGWRVGVVSFSHEGVDAVKGFVSDEPALAALEAELSARPQLKGEAPLHPDPRVVGSAFEAITQLPWADTARIVHYARGGRGDHVTLAEPGRLRVWACGGSVSFGPGGRSPLAPNDTATPADDVDRRVQEQWTDDHFRSGGPRQP